MLMLGHDLRVRRFNPQAERFFNLQASDVGKPIREVRPSVGLPHLEEACLDVSGHLRTALAPGSGCQRPRTSRS